MLIFRSGLPISIPQHYATDPDHLAVVQQLTTTNAFAEAITILERHPDGYLAADILSGAPWAQRYLRTMGKMWSGVDRPLAQRAARALLGVLAGTKPKIGRPPRVLTAAQTSAGAAAIARCRALVDRVWSDDRADLAAAVIKAHSLSGPHRRALTALVRRRGLRRAELVLSLASWETGISIRRLRLTRPVADLVYG